LPVTKVPTTRDTVIKFWQNRNDRPYIFMEQEESSPFMQSRGIVCFDSTFLEDPQVIAQSINRLKAPRRRGPRCSLSMASITVTSQSQKRMTMPTSWMPRSSSTDLE
jgi:hypothetical protein